MTGGARLKCRNIYKQGDTYIHKHESRAVTNDYSHYF